MIVSRAQETRKDESRTSEGLYSSPRYTCSDRHARRCGSSLSFCLILPIAPSHSRVSS